MAKSKKTSKKSYKGRRTIGKKSSKKRRSRKSSKRSSKISAEEIDDMKSILSTNTPMNQSQGQFMGNQMQQQVLSPSRVDPLMVNNSVPAQQSNYNFTSPVAPQSNISNLFMNPNQLSQSMDSVMTPQYSAMVSPQSVVSPSHQKLQHLGYPQPQAQQPQANIGNLFLNPNQLQGQQQSNIGNLFMNPNQVESMEVNV